MTSEYPEVSTGVATVYFYGTRRFLTKRGAFEAKARDMMRGSDHFRSEFDHETGYSEVCDCFSCSDAMGVAHKAITRALMRGEPIPADYANELPTTPTPDEGASA